MMIALLAAFGALAAVLLGRKYGNPSLPAVLALALCCGLSLGIYFYASSFARANEILFVAAGGVLLSVGVYALTNALCVRRLAAQDASGALRASGPRKPLVEFEEEAIEPEEAAEKRFEGPLTEAEEKAELPKLWEEEAPETESERLAFEAALDEALLEAPQGGEAESDEPDDLLAPKAEEDEETEEIEVTGEIEEIEEAEEPPEEAFEAEDGESAEEETLRQTAGESGIPPLVLPQIVEEDTLREESAFYPPLEEEPEAEAETAAEAAEAEEYVPAPEPKIVSEPEFEEPAAEEPAPEPEIAPEPEPALEPEPVAEPGAESDPEFEEPAAEEPAPEPEIAPEPEPVLEPEPVAEPGAEPEPEFEEPAAEE
ncbi:MAG: hypothetical protein LLF87_01030, partial [Eubacteriales bacterium]|nr:hypothetical protein [Eubacteriales bacterium]